MLKRYYCPELCTLIIFIFPTNNIYDIIKLHQTLVNKLVDEVVIRSTLDFLAATIAILTIIVNMLRN